jgi:hypothetical protein
LPLAAGNRDPVLTEQDHVGALLLVQLLREAPGVDPARRQPVDHPGAVGGSDEKCVVTTLE